MLAFLSLATLCLAKKKEFVVSARSMELKEEGSNGYRLAIVLAGVTKVFHLRRKEEKVSLWMIGEEGNLREPRIAKTVAVYEDPAKGASLLVTRAGNSTWAEVKGMLGPGQIIQPHDGGASPSRRGALRTGPHKVSSGEVVGAPLTHSSVQVLSCPQATTILKWREVVAEVAGGRAELRCRPRFIQKSLSWRTLPSTRAWAGAALPSSNTSHPISMPST